VHKLAVSMWVIGLLSYAVTAMSSSDTAIEVAPIAPTQTSSAYQRMIPVGATLAEIVERRADHVAAPAPELINEPAEKVVVSRPVFAHSKPTISAPTSYRFAQGKELQVLYLQNGWIKVLDPVTKFEGWVPGARGKILRTPIPSPALRFAPAKSTLLVSCACCHRGRTRPMTTARLWGFLVRMELAGARITRALG
jgi:hypothetical protein